jgi:predicted lipid-binding transport protein (Tim44 family)
VRYYLSPPPLNPVARILAGLLAVAALVGAFFFGLIILAVAVGLGVVAWLVLTVRVWWLRRRFRAGRGDGEKPAGHATAGGVRKPDVIDAEYEVISRSEDD